MSADPLASISSTLKDLSLIPDVLPSSYESFQPTHLLSVVYPGGKEVLLGNEFGTAETQEEPEIRWAPLSLSGAEAASSGEDGSKEVGYTLAMLDPDAPSGADPIYRSFRHWVITGLKPPATTGSATEHQNALKARPATTPYRPPGPRPNSGLHRYTFLLFEEPPAYAGPAAGAVEFGAALEERRSWDAIKFAEREGLKLVGVSWMLIRSE